MPRLPLTTRPLDTPDHEPQVTQLVILQVIDVSLHEVLHGHAVALERFRDQVAGRELGVRGGVVTGITLPQGQ